MAALFKRGPRLGPIGPFKSWPKVSTVAAFKTRNVAISLGLGPRLRYRS